MLTLFLLIILVCHNLLSDTNRDVHYTEIERMELLQLQAPEAQDAK